MGAEGRIQASHPSLLPSPRDEMDRGGETEEGKKSRPPPGQSASFTRGHLFG